MEANLAPAVSDTDMDLAERVHDAIYALDVLRGTRSQVEVIAANGHITLRGVLQSPMAAVEVERAAAEVPGVAGVTSHIVDDATLSRHVANVLGSDPSTASIPPGYEVTSVFGHLTLIGYFTDAQAAALKAVCRTVPGVRTVKIKAL